MLMHEIEVLAFAEPGVDRPARKRMALRVLTRLAALDGALQPPAGVLVVQQVRPVVQDDLADDLGHGVEVLQGV